MNAGLVVLIAGVLTVTAWQWRAHWRARAAVPAGRPTSTRMLTAQGLAGGILLAQPGARWLTAAIDGASGVSGLDSAPWPAAIGSTVVAAGVGIGGLDVGYRGLWRGSGLRPLLHHAPLAVVLPAVALAGVPLLHHTASGLGVELSDAVVACAGPGQPIAGFEVDRLANAAVIVEVGQRMGVPERGQVIAVATAMQESSLRNLDHGDRDSVGLFQQRPSQGWGTTSQVRDPAHAATTFYQRLLAVPGWDSMPMWQAAQAVQRSAYPTFYARWEGPAQQVVRSIAGNCNPT